MLVVALVLSACGETSVNPNAPTVTSTNPSSASTGVNTNATISAIFSTPMDGTTIVSPLTTFTVTQAGVTVPGTVTYVGSTATFTPTNLLAVSTLFSGIDFATEATWWQSIEDEFIVKTRLMW